MTIEMNMNLKMIQRNSYSILDLLSDIGGMLGMLISGINFLLIFWNYNYFENYLVTRLFKLQRIDLERKEINKRPYFARSSFMVPRRCYNPKEFCRDLLPNAILSRCKCCQADRLERGFEKARASLMKEINIIEIVKSRRFFKKALKLLLSKKKRMELKERSRYISIDPKKKII